jgi:hypothetical protein
MISITKIKNRNYLVNCPCCSGIGILQPHRLDPRPVYTDCYLCNGIKKVKKVDYDSFQQ